MKKRLPANNALVEGIPVLIANGQLQRLLLQFLQRH